MPSQPDAYKQFEDYTNKIEQLSQQQLSSEEVMTQCCSEGDGVGLQKYFMQIEEWLAGGLTDGTHPNALSGHSKSPNNNSAQLGFSPGSENNKALVIEAASGTGKKTLLVKWHQYHQAAKDTKRNDLIIMNFASVEGNSSNYYYAIYRILIKLREQLGIDQKVQLHQQKLRKYFSYWLDVCNQRIEQQSIQKSDNIYSKIILVFEGIDFFLDRGTGREGNIAFWLPKTFPKNVKVIVTADKDSQSIKYFEKLGCTKIKLQADPAVSASLVSAYKQKPIYISTTLRQRLFSILSKVMASNNLSILGVRAFLCCLMPQRDKNDGLSKIHEEKLIERLNSIDFDRLSLARGIDDVLDFVIDLWRQHLFRSENQFKQLMGVMIYTQKGLTLSELILITHADPLEMKMFTIVFKEFLINFKGLLMIKNDSFKRALIRKCEFKGRIITVLNEKIAEGLKKTPNSVRKLEEETFQLYSAGNYFKLKEVVSDIENFLLLFNSYTKYDLCRYWQKLQERSFDPVIEYNKAIEGFQTHYHPSPDDLFRIITQISRFLKQFSDFETYYTPEFRHPKLIGNSKELDDIGILGEFRNLSLCQDDQDLPSTSISTDPSEEADQNEGTRKLRRRLKQMYDKINEGKLVRRNEASRVNQGSPGLSASQGDPTSRVLGNPMRRSPTSHHKKKPKEVRVEQQNVEVKSNEEAFRKVYYEQIKDFLKKMSLDGEKEPEYVIEEREDECQDSDADKSGDQSSKIKKIESQRQRSKLENLPDLKNLYAYTVEEEFELSQKAPTNYYYKRWIWMQFPWVCMTMKCNYSEKLRKCFTSPTAYMSVEEERQFTLQALKIALEAKKKKQAVLERVEPASRKEHKNHSAASYSPEDNLMHTSSTNRLSRPDRMLEQKNRFFGSNISLVALSKEIEEIQKEGSLNTDQMSRSIFITNEDKIGLMNSSTLTQGTRKKKSPKVLEEFSGNSAKAEKGILPRIKQSAKQEMLRDLGELERNNMSIRKEVDSFLYKNQQLAKRLQQLKTIYQNSLTQLNNEKKTDEKLRRVTELESKIQKVKMQYAYSLLQHERLDVLIKICKRNKTHNEEAIPSLVLECTNFKKMIKIETEAIVKLKKKTEEIKKITKKYIENCHDRLENEFSISQQIKETYKNMETFQQEVARYDHLIADEIEVKRKQLQETVFPQTMATKQPQAAYELMKKTIVNPDDEQTTQLCAHLERLIDLNAEDYRQCPKFQALVQGLAKKREFLASIEEKKMELDELKKKVHENNGLLKKMQHAHDRDHRPDSVDLDDGRNVEKEQLDKAIQTKRRVLQKLTSQRLSCLGVLNTWCAKLGLPQMTTLSVTPQLQSALIELRRKAVAAQ